MKYPPINYKPGTIRVANGRPARSADALEVDAFSTYLATSRKLQPPAIIGAPLRAGIAYTFALRIPPATTAIAVDALAVGAGTITLTSTTDLHTAAIPVNNVDGSEYLWAHATMHTTGETYKPDEVGEDGLQRTLTVTPDTTWTLATLTVELADAGASDPNKLAVYGLRIRYLPVLEGDALPE